MTDWAEDAFGKLNRKRENERIERDRILELQRVKKAHGVPLWNKVQERIRVNLSALNQKQGGILEIQEQQPDRMVVRRAENGKILEVAFNPETSKLSWSCSGKSETAWEIQVNEDGWAGFVWGMGVPTRIDSIAIQMLNALLEI